MNLKKSDKIIAVVGVIILIVAAVGVILYVPSDDEVTPMKKEEETYTYAVDYRVLNTTATPDKTQYIVKDKLIGSGDYVGKVEISKKNLKSVEFKFSYTDDKRGLFGLGILFPNFFGADTITIDVKDSEKNKIGNGEIKGSGNKKINTEDISPMHCGPIEAKSMAEAEERLEENLTMDDLEMEMETYTITVSLDVKEGFFFKFFGWLREKLLGNDQFTLEITYEYYDYYIVEPEMPENGGPKESETPTEFSSTPYVSMNYVGGFH